jgi:hypothetical protein
MYDGGRTALTLGRAFGMFHIHLTIKALRRGCTTVQPYAQTGQLASGVVSKAHLAFGCYAAFYSADAMNRVPTGS